MVGGTAGGCRNDERRCGGVGEPLDEWREGGLGGAVWIADAASVAPADVSICARAVLDTGDGKSEARGEADGGDGHRHEGKRCGAGRTCGAWAADVSGSGPAGTGIGSGGEAVSGTKLWVDGCGVDEAG